MNKSIWNLDENIAAALSYIFGIVSGGILLVFEKENKFVRFHAMQSVLLSVFVIVVEVVLQILGRIPLLGGIFVLANNIFGFIALVAAIWLIVSALKMKKQKLPLIGDVAEKQIEKT
ncbi:membrane protein [Clostridia bacterium]|nr:membrane protein [Clostridia bacterium]